MSKRDIREIKRAWALTIVAATLGLLINLLANALYDWMLKGFSWDIFRIFLFSSLVSVFFVDYFSFLIDRIDKTSTNKIDVWEYLKSKFNKLSKK